MKYEKVTDDNFSLIEDLVNWQVHNGVITTEFFLKSFSEGGEIAAGIADMADTHNHHPDINLRYPGTVRVLLTTHDAGCLTTHDVDLARAINTWVHSRSHS